MNPKALLVSRCYRNLAILSLGMLCNMSSYRTLEAMQSSLNKGIGVSSLAVVYGTSLISGILLPPYLIMKLKCRKCLLLAPIAYATYTVANFYPSLYTLLPASFILGLGTSALWPAASVYIIDLSALHASLIKHDALAMTGRYFGIFWGVGNISGIFGMIFLVVLFNTLNQNTSISTSDIALNSTVRDTFTGITVSYQNTSDKTTVNVTSCGLYHSIDDHPSNPNANLSDTVLYSMYTGFLVLNLLTSVLYFFLDEVEEITPKELQQNPRSKTQNLAVKCTAQILDGKPPKCHLADETPANVENIHLMEKDKFNGDDECSDGERKQVVSPPLNTRSGLKIIKEVSHLFMKNKCGLLLATLSVSVGMTQAMVRGTFLAAWVTCTNGIEYTVYVMLCFGIALSVGSIFSGYLLKLTSFIPLFTIALVLNLGMLTGLLILQTEQDLSLTYFFLAGVVALANGIFNSQLPNVYNAVFPSQKSAAVTLNAVWLNGGTAILYLVSVFTLPVVSVVTLMSAISVGFVTFVIAYKIKDSTHKKWGCATSQRTNVDRRNVNPQTSKASSKA